MRTVEIGSVIKLKHYEVVGVALTGTNQRIICRLPAAYYLIVGETELMDHETGKLHPMWRVVGKADKKQLEWMVAKACFVK